MAQADGEIMIASFIAGLYTFAFVFLLALVIALLFINRTRHQMNEQRKRQGRLLRAWFKSKNVPEEEW